MEVTIDVLLANFKTVKDELPTTIKEAFFKNEKQIIKLNQNQLWDGKTNTGEDIRPYYSEDSFFKTIGQAKGYIKWKQKITPNPRRNPDAPNFYINGFFHRSLRLAEENGYVIVISNLTGKMANDIVDEYANILGLTPEHQLIIDNEKIIPEIWELLEKYV